MCPSKAKHRQLYVDSLFQWSFGITCWEIFNGGKTPYPGISPADLPHQLETGFRMDKPLNAACSDDVYVSCCIEIVLIGHQCSIV